MFNFYLMQTSFLLIFPSLITIFPSIRYFLAALCFLDSLLISLYWLPQPSCSTCSFPREYTQFAYLKTRLSPTTASSSLILSLFSIVSKYINSLFYSLEPPSPANYHHQNLSPKDSFPLSPAKLFYYRHFKNSVHLASIALFSFRSSLWMSTGGFNCSYRIGAPQELY